MHRIVSKDEERIDYFFKITEFEGTPKNIEKDKCECLKWFDSRDLPKNTIPYIKHALSEIQLGKHFTEFNQLD